MHDVKKGMWLCFLTAISITGTARLHHRPVPAPVATHPEPLMISACCALQPMPFPGVLMWRPLTNCLECRLQTDTHLPSLGSL